jgi:hypothetical protein
VCRGDAVTGAGWGGYRRWGGLGRERKEGGFKVLRRGAVEDRGMKEKAYICRSKHPFTLGAELNCDSREPWVG